MYADFNALGVVPEDTGAIFRPLGEITPQGD